MPEAESAIGSTTPSQDIQSLFWMITLILSNKYTSTDKLQSVTNCINHTYTHTKNTLQMTRTAALRRQVAAHDISRNTPQKQELNKLV
jgi:hypothetical protein